MKIYFKLVLTAAYLLILATISSCNQNNHMSVDDNVKTVHLELVDSISVFLDTHTSTETNSFNYYYDRSTGIEYLIYYDKVNENIIFINLDKGEIISRVKIETEGKNAINYFSGFAIKSIDSIYVFSAGLKIYQMNHLGEIENVIRYDTINDNAFPLVPLSSFSIFHSNAIIVKDNLYSIQGDANYHYYNEADPTVYTFCYKLDLNDFTIEAMRIHHPKDFWENGIRELSVSWDYNGSGFIYSPLYSHSIYLSNDNKKIDKIIEVQSNYVNKILHYNPNLPSSQEEYFKARVENQRYLGIIYDKYRNVYYRFFWPGYSCQDLSAEEIIKIYKNPPTFGISVISSKFEIIDELVLPNNIYSQHKYFVTKKGLALSADHPQNPNLKEDEWCFHIYNFFDKK